MRISVIVPVLNEEAGIDACLQDLRCLRRLGHEVIVVDGGSTDATRTRAAPHCDKLLRSRPGRARQMNLGARHASGEILLFLHADNKLQAGARRLVEELLTRGQNGWGWFKLRLSGRLPVFRLIAALINGRSRLSRICTGDQSLFVSAELFRAAGGFPDIPLMEDIAICKALGKLERPRPSNLPTLSSSRRWESAGVARTILQMWWLRWLYFCGVSPASLAARYYPQHFGGAPRHKFAAARILVFAREPKAGAVKRRLAAQIGEQAALRLYRAMLRRVVATVEQRPLAEYRLWVTSNREHEDFLALCNAQDIHLQRGADLGARMIHAAATELAQDAVESVLIVGSDCPALTLDYLEQALQALAQGFEVVIGPARDGGFVLIGLRKARAELFHAVDWGGPEVLRQTLHRVRGLGIRHHLLEVSWDVDDAEDLPLLDALRPPLSCSN